MFFIIALSRAWRALKAFLSIVFCLLTLLSFKQLLALFLVSLYLFVSCFFAQIKSFKVYTILHIFSISFVWSWHCSFLFLLRISIGERDWGSLFPSWLEKGLMTFQSSTKLSYPLFFCFSRCYNSIPFLFVSFLCFLLPTFLFLFVSCVVFFNFFGRFIDSVFHLCFFFYNHSCIVVGASPNNTIVTFMLVHWGYLILSFLLFSCHWIFLFPFLVF